MLQRLTSIGGEASFFVATRSARVSCRQKKEKNNWILFSEVSICDKTLFLDLDSVIPWLCHKHAKKNLATWSLGQQPIHTIFLAFFCQVGRESLVTIKQIAIGTIQLFSCLQVHIIQRKTLIYSYKQLNQSPLGNQLFVSFLSSEISLFFQV